MSTADRALSMVDVGDTLSIDPDVGKPYRARVIEKLPGERAIEIRYSSERGEQTRRISATELATWHVTGRLVVNPPNRRPTPSRRRSRP